jgi:hypothetical protein
VYRDELWCDFFVLPFTKVTLALNYVALLVVMTGQFARHGGLVG